MDNRVGAAKYPLIGVAPLDPHAGLVGGDDLGMAQHRNGLVALGCESALRPTQHVHQATLTDGQTEQVDERALQPLVGQGLEGFEIGRHSMQPGPEWRPFRRIGHGRDDQRAARRAMHRPSPMPLDHRLDRGQFDRLMLLTVSAGRSLGRAALQQGQLSG